MQSDSEGIALGYIEFMVISNPDVEDLVNHTRYVGIGERRGMAVSEQDADHALAFQTGR